MSLVRALRCASSAPRLVCTPSFRHRPLHSSAHRRDAENGRDDGPKPVSTSPPLPSEKAKAYVKPYTEEDRKKLEEKYTPEQLAAVDVGEAAVDPEDLYEQGMMRDDVMGVEYIDDFSKIRPYIDNPIKPPEEYYDPDMRAKTDEELAEDLYRFADSLPEVDPESDETFDGSETKPKLWEWKKFYDNVRVMKGKPEADLQATNYVQPALPKLTDPAIRRTVRASKTSTGTENDLWWQELSKQTGWDIVKLRSLRVKKLVQHRVANQTRMGKVAKQYILYIAGDGKGLLGIGEGSAVLAQQANFKARRNAIRNMVPITRYENRTIYGDVKGKVGATELELFTRPPGFGLRCQEKIFEMCKCAGISDISARVTRARNPMNTIKATMQALQKQRDPELVSRARGRKMVDARKVYYAGLI